MPSPAETRAKNKKKLQEESGLAITSLMDMMTIILVFLLKSYSVEDIQVKPSADLKLPLSTAKKEPEVAVNVVISKRTLSVDGVKVIDVDPSSLEVADEYKRGTMITPLYDTLQEKADDAKALAARNPNQPFKGRLLLQCDKDIPFSLLREVMYTAGQAQFGEFKFVVFKSEGE
jgi:biopolymer transport protein ExbD